MNRCLKMILLLWWCCSAQAQVISVAPQYQQRYENILEELRCLVCQNQTVAESSSDLANDLRLEVKAMLEAGSSDQQIMDFMSDRYGDFVLYRPPLKARTLLLWLSPFGLLAGGLLMAFLIVRKRARATPGGPLDRRDKERLQHLLNDRHGGKHQPGEPS